MTQRTSKAEQIHQTQSGPKHRRKSSDLRRRLEAVNDRDEVTLDGRPFHARFRVFQSRVLSTAVSRTIGGTRMCHVKPST